ncbi:hypothetical protein FIBSPDRAFT_1035882, partial [Athelia psychrophila]
MASSYMYHVMRHTDDQHHGVEDTDLRGTYWTLEEANAAARKDLTEWSPDFFESYDVTMDDDGMVDIEATCPEGEIMHVYIEKKKAPPRPQPPIAKPIPETKPSSSATKEKSLTLDADLNVQLHALAPKDVWVILQTDYDHHTDEEGRSHLASAVVYDSLKRANEIARALLLEAAGHDPEEEQDEDDEMDEDEVAFPVECSELNKGSLDKPYKAVAYVREEEVDNICME